MARPRRTQVRDWLDAKEATIRHEVTRRLRGAGWLAFQFSVARRVERQWRDWPDIVAVKADYALLVQAKRPSGVLTEGQLALEARLRQETGRHVQYIVVRLPDEIDGWLVPGEGEWARCWK